MTVLIDSWAWIEYWKGGKNSRSAAEYIEGQEEAFISVINIIEVYTWFSRYYNETTAKERIDFIEDRCYIVPLDKEISLDAAKMKVKHKLGIADSVVLATSKHVNGKVVTGDPDFEGIEGVLFIG